jgi:hypothetical protein
MSGVRVQVEVNTARQTARVLVLDALGNTIAMLPIRHVHVRDDENTVGVVAELPEVAAAKVIGEYGLLDEIGHP